MRVLRTILTTFLVLALLSIGALFAARSALLWWGSYSLIQATKSLQRSGRGPQYLRQCQQEVGSDVNVTLTPEPQMRFLSNTEYMAEILCDGFSESGQIVAVFYLVKGRDTKRSVPGFKKRIHVASFGFCLFRRCGASSQQQCRHYENQEFFHAISPLLDFNFTTISMIHFSF